MKYKSYVMVSSFLLLPLSLASMYHDPSELTVDEITRCILDGNHERALWLLLDKANFKKAKRFLKPGLLENLIPERQYKPIENYRLFKRAIRRKERPTDTHTREGLSALMFACARGDAHFAKQLLTTGLIHKSERVDVNERGPLQYTPLNYAVRAGHLPTVQVLLDHGVTIEPGVLIDALGAGNTHLLPVLINAGADIHFKTKEMDDATPLIIAANRGDIEAVKMLLAKSADVHACTIQGVDAMTVCIARNRPDIALLLLQHGATFNAVRQFFTGRLA